MEMLGQVGEYFAKGGAVMYLLLLCSISVLTIGIERYLYFQAADSGSKFAQQFCIMLRQDDYNAAAGFAASCKGETARIITMAMAKTNLSVARLEAILETEAGIAAAKLRRRLYYLSVVVTLAPLLGLLGTISGMISSFSIFNMQAGEPLAITGGIGEALIATACGLCVAILALCIHSYFVQRQDSVITDMEQCFSTLVEQWGWRQES